MVDDHEVVDDWGITSDDEIGPARIAGALEAYRRFQGGLNPPGRPADQFNLGFTLGKFACYLLDERSHRGKGQPRVLGREQLRRFRRWCRSAAALDADVIAIASSAPLAYLPTNRLEELVGEAVTVTGGPVRRTGRRPDGALRQYNISRLVVEHAGARCYRDSSRRSRDAPTAS
jgi:hypothetical protein